MEIILEENSGNEGTGGRYVYTFEDGTEAQLTFQQHGDLMIINHVGVPTHHRNNGLAAKLVESAVDGARKKQLKVNPVCPYAAVQFRRHPQWSDLLQ